MAAAAAAVAMAMEAAVAAYFRGCMLFIVKIFLCGIFMMCGGDWCGLILLIHCISFTTAQCSWCADRDALKLK